MAKDSDSQENPKVGRQLFQAGLQALARRGWRITRVAGVRSPILRQIERDRERHIVCIPTSTNQFIGFQPMPDGGWKTLDQADVVLAVCVDDPKSPRNALVLWLDVDRVRNAFNRAREVRWREGHIKPEGAPIFLRLFGEEDPRWQYIGGGFAEGVAPYDTLRLADVPATRDTPAPSRVASSASAAPVSPSSASRPSGAPVSMGVAIAEAKRGLSQLLGVPESAIKITIEA